MLSVNICRQQLLSEVDQRQQELAELTTQLEGERFGNAQLLARVEAASGALAELKTNVEACSASQASPTHMSSQACTCSREDFVPAARS